MSDPVVKSIVLSRTSLLFNHAFFGQLAIRLNLIDASQWCNTLATDGVNLYYNREFMKNLTPDETKFVLGHEILHVVYDHLGRRGKKDPKIHNMATDYIVNSTLVAHQVGKMPKGGLLSAKYTDDMTSEEVYYDLKKNSVQIQLPLDMHLDLGSDGDGGDNDDGNGGKNGTDITVVGGPNGPPKLTEEDLQRIRDQVKADVLNAVQQCGAGNVPAGIRRLIKDLTEPQLDWRALLEMQIQSVLKDDYTFDRPSRRSWHTGCILPGLKFKQKLAISCAIDLSGSISDKQAQDFLSETKGIMTCYEDFELIVWTFDTKVYNPVIFTPDNVDDIYNYKPKGGGGTMFECNWEFMKDPIGHGYGDIFGEPITPLKFVMFTDGLPNSTWGDPNYCSTLFIVHGDRHIKAPFGTTAYYTEKAVRK